MLSEKLGCPSTLGEYDSSNFMYASLSSISRISLKLGFRESRVGEMAYKMATVRCGTLCLCVCVCDSSSFNSFSRKLLYLPSLGNLKYNSQRPIKIFVLKA